MIKSFKATGKENRTRIMMGRCVDTRAQLRCTMVKVEIEVLRYTNG